MEVNVKIEKQLSDKFYACYMLDEFETFALVGYGKTASEAKEDFLVSYKEIKELVPNVPDLEFNYVYDIASFFDMFPFLNAEHVARKANISPCVMRQYISLNKVPSKRRLDIIKETLNDIAKEISATVIGA